MSWYFTSPLYETQFIVAMLNNRHSARVEARSQRIEIAIIVLIVIEIVIGIQGCRNHSVESAIQHPITMLECLDRIIPIGERHFQRAVAEYIAHYHTSGIIKGPVAQKSLLFSSPELGHWS